MDIDRDGSGCHTVWHSDERAPSVVPKLSLGAGLVYTYTKPKRDDIADAWYLTAIDFDTGKTCRPLSAARGFGFNNNYAPVTIRPGRRRLRRRSGGLVRLADAG